MLTAHTVSAPTTAQRILVASGCAMLTVAVIYWRQVTAGTLSDADQLWYAARALLAGSDPYAAVGPGKAFEWAWPLLYPMPAVLLAVPFAPLPDIVASMLFSAGSTFILAFLLTRDSFGRLPLLASGCMMDATRVSQNTPLLTAAILSPSLYWLAAAKPNIGLAMCAATASRRALYTALAGGAVLLALSFACDPAWVTRWQGAIGAVSHTRIPLLAFGGPLLCLAVLKWRREEARLLLGFACVPHTAAPYDVLPLGLVARTFRESLAFACLSVVSQLIYESYALTADRAAMIQNLTMYIPCLLAVLLRPNEGDPPAWLSFVRPQSARAVVRSAAP